MPDMKTPLLRSFNNSTTVSPVKRYHLARIGKNGKLDRLGPGKATHSEQAVAMRWGICTLRCTSTTSLAVDNSFLKSSNGLITARSRMRIIFGGARQVQKGR